MKTADQKVREKIDTSIDDGFAWTTKRIDMVRGEAVRRLEEDDQCEVFVGADRCDRIVALMRDELLVLDGLVSEILGAQRRTDIAILDDARRKRQQESRQQLGLLEGVEITPCGRCSESGVVTAKIDGPLVPEMVRSLTARELLCPTCGGLGEVHIPIDDPIPRRGVSSW